MTQRPGDPDALIQLGISQYRRGDFAAAASSSRKALKLRPAHTGALSLLGISLNAQGLHAKAAAAFAELTRREPSQVGHWINLGTALRAQRKYADAIAAYEQAGRRGAASADFHYNVGLACLDTGDYEKARDALSEAARLAADDAEICYQYAACCDEMMRQDEALEALRGWRRKRGLTTDLLARVGLLLMKLGEMRGASEAVALAMRDPHPDAEAVLRMIQVQERTNQLPEARAAFARLRQDPGAAALAPELTAMEARLADREGRIEDAERLYREMLAGTPAFHLRHQHLFPLAKVLDALGRHEQAFEALDEAHRSQIDYLRRITPNAPAWRNPPFRIAEFGCQAQDVADWNAADGPPAAESPVFIVGFPRSGTTLLEQTLDAHPALVSMDETRYLYEVVDRVAATGVAYPEQLGRLTRLQLDELRGAYWTRVRRRVAVGPGQRLVDKNPLNILALPAIRRLFPNSRILLAVRHPCDVVLSCYMQHFRAPDFTLLCRDLPSLAAGYRRAYDFWYREAAMLQPAAREVRYESFVTGFEQEARSIADFLDLEWTDAMLAPGEHARSKGFISTPSYSQVVQPVHTRAIGRWKAYERHFAGALHSLEPLLQRWGYAG